ncbi:spermidine hydroxycinnamoyl transferase-like [Olea europaea subsp. europaea]|uniref:Spermidine hydroxycinnamoyl transferase-like n=1 Tax=Olea europaea subsp. europaea TaxID=158383 RepID=A0A8S0VIL6_OLEEU|nr:spermidine hydroxycinnamoyl transferase-like [Olea europaea subsp. europaea]
MVTVAATHTVKPTESTPNEIMQLSEIDQTKTLIHAPTVYFYRLNEDILYSHAIQILKESLSKALVLFYPLAGRLHEIGGGRLELHCNAEGATLVEAESELMIEDYEIQDFVPNEAMRELITKVDYIATPIHEQPLVLVQLTKFSCGGVCLGLGISHILADGISAIHFVSEWAKIARGEMTSIFPLLDRKILRLGDLPSVPKFEHIELTPPPLLVGRSDNMEERKKPTTVAMIKLSKQQINELKSKANEETPYKSIVRPYTRYEAVAGHMWRCTTKVRGHKNEQLTRLHLAVDLRNRIQPPIPKGYFGNAVIRQATIATTRDLLSNPLAYASSRIRESIDKVTDEYIRSYLLVANRQDISWLRNFPTKGCSLGSFYGNPNMEITSWTSMSVYEADFGWGDLIHMGPAEMGFDGKSFIIPSCEGDGSIMVAFCLQTEHIGTFKQLFYEEI